jgi:hypothetical protein
MSISRRVRLDRKNTLRCIWLETPPNVVSPVPRQVTHEDPEADEISLPDRITSTSPLPVLKLTLSSRSMSSMD